MKVYFTGHVLRDILKFFSIPELPLFHPCRTEVHVAGIVKWACYAQVIPVLTIKDFAIWTVPYMQMPLSWLRFLFAYLRVFYVGGFHWSIYENKIINHICDEASVFVVVSVIERLHLGWSGRKPLSRHFIGKPLNVRLWKFWGVQLFIFLQKNLCNFSGSTCQATTWLIHESGGEGSKIQPHVLFLSFAAVGCKRSTKDNLLHLGCCFPPHSSPCTFQFLASCIWLHQLPPLPIFVCLVKYT